MIPLVSIIMPVYNKELYLNRALENICNQTFDNWELIVINDGSTDNSKIVIEKYKNDLVKVQEDIEIMQNTCNLEEGKLEKIKILKEELKGQIDDLTEEIENSLKNRKYSKLKVYKPKRC